jgi:hypothetical protein
VQINRDAVMGLVPDGGEASFQGIHFLVSALAFVATARGKAHRNSGLQVAARVSIPWNQGEPEICTLDDSALFLESDAVDVIRHTTTWGRTRRRIRRVPVGPKRPFAP